MKRERKEEKIKKEKKMQGWAIALIIIGVLLLVGVVITAIVMSLSGPTLTVTQSNVAGGVQMSWNVTPVSFTSTYLLYDETKKTIVLPLTTTPANSVLIPASILVIGNKYTFEVSSKATVGGGAANKGSKTFVYGTA
jgi:flagellar basal body-associated protein FliL